MSAKCAALALILGTAVGTIFISAANASITFSAGTPGTGLAATATFDNSVAGTLKVTLANVGGDVLVPADVLTGIFFDLSAGSPLTPLSVVVASGSGVVFDAAATDVGGEWAYATGLSGAPLGANTGISSSGLGLFGDANFPGANLDGPTAVNGMNYGLLSAVDNLATGNAQVTGGEPYVKSAVVITFTTTGTFDTSRLSDVSFQYGTDLDEPNIPADPNTPEPASVVIWCMGMALAGAGLKARQAKRRAT